MKQKNLFLLLEVEKRYLSPPRENQIQNEHDLARVSQFFQHLHSEAPIHSEDVGSHLEL